MKNNVKIDVPFYFDYCCKPCALYVNNILITEDVRGCEFELLMALGYRDSEINQKQVDQEWIESIGFKFPEHLEGVKFAENVK